MADTLPWQMDWSAGGVPPPPGPAGGPAAAPPGGAKPWQMNWSAGAQPAGPDPTDPGSFSPSRPPLPMASRIATGAPEGGRGTSARAQGIRETISGQPAGAPRTGSGQEAFENQQAIEARLRGQGLTDEQIQADPDWQASARGLNRQVAAADTGTAIGVGAGDLAAPLIARAVAPVARSVGYLYGRLTGRATTEGVEKLTGEALRRSSGAATSQTAQATAHEAEAQRADVALRQIRENQPGVAAQRAQSQAPTLPLEAERLRVVSELRQRARGLETEYRRAGFGTEQAKRMVAQAERQVQDTEQAVAQLEQELLAKPGMNADEFGQKLRAVTQQMSDKYTKIRTQQSGLSGAIEEAGDALRVNTSAVQNTITGMRKSVRNPQLSSVLDGVEELLKTDGHNALSVRSTESLRKFLDNIVRTKSYSGTAVDTETVHYVAQIKKQLMASATSASKPYRDALAKWRVLSRPLDIVERKGGLAKVLDTDPMSSEYALSQAQVVGRVISQARAGNPTLGRLLQASPDLKDAARLYFTQDLFGKEAVPTTASLRTWLKTNETPLRQTGLYDEFRDIRTARDAASRAVQDAKGARAQSVAQLREAEGGAASVKQDLSRAESLRDKEIARIEAAGRGRTTPDQIEKQSAKRAGQATSRLEGKRTAAQGARDQALKNADKYRQFTSKLRIAKGEEIPTLTKQLVDDLRKAGQLTDSQYEQQLAQIQRVSDNIKDSERARATFRRIGLATIGLAAGGGALYEGRRILGVH